MHCNKNKPGALNPQSYQDQNYIDISGLEKLKYTKKGNVNSKTGCLIVGPWQKFVVFGKIHIDIWEKVYCSEGLQHHFQEEKTIRINHLSISKMRL